MYSYINKLVESKADEIDINACIPTEVDFIKLHDRINTYRKMGNAAGWINTPWGLASSIKDINKAIRYTFIAIVLKDKDFRKALLDSLLKLGLEKEEVGEILYKIADRASEYRDLILRYSLEEQLKFENINEDIEKHDELNPKLWENNKLKPEVKEKIELIVNEFLDGLKEDEIKFKLDDAWLTGSNASFNWTKNSDLDVHLLFDLSIYTDEEKQAMADLLYSYYTKNWRNKLTITIYGIPVELYIETNYEK